MTLILHPLFLSFPPGLGFRLFVTWFALSSFVIPLSVLSFCYVNICSAIRHNLRAKQEGRGAVNLVSASASGAKEAAIG